MLKRDHSRQPLTRRVALAVIGATVAVIVPVAAIGADGQRAAAARPVIRADVPLSPSAVVQPMPVAARAVRRTEAAPPIQEKPATISGRLYDPLGGVLPGVIVTLTDQTVGATYSAVTDVGGTFAFRELQPATYELVAQLPGFATVSSVMPIGAGVNVERRIVMPIGTLEETITVGCSFAPGPAGPRPRATINQRSAGARERAVQPAEAPPLGGGADRPIRVGGQIRAPMQIAKANPVCPNHVGVDTIVALTGRVGIDGYLSDIHLVNAADNPAADIVESAIEAVRLWEYTPTLLNGVPVDANIRITVYYNW